MASTLAAVTTGAGGIVATADNSGNINLVAGSTTAIACTATGTTVAGILGITTYLETAPAIVNSSTTQTIALANGTVLSYTLTGNCTFTMPATTNGTSFVIRLIQDATGSRTATFTGVKWPGGTPPTITVTASTGVDILSFVCIASVWYGTFAQGFA